MYPFYRLVRLVHPPLEADEELLKAMEKSLIHDTNTHGTNATAVQAQLNHKLVGYAKVNLFDWEQAGRLVASDKNPRNIDKTRVIMMRKSLESGAQRFNPKNAMPAEIVASELRIPLLKSPWPADGEDYPTLTLDDLPHEQLVGLASGWHRFTSLKSMKKTTQQEIDVCKRLIENATAMENQESGILDGDILEQARLKKVRAEQQLLLREAVLKGMGEWLLAFYDKGKCVIASYFVCD